MASGILAPSRRAQGRHPHEHHLVENLVGAIADEFHHLKAIEEKGDSPLTALLVLAQVALGLLVVVSLEMIVAMSFYFGWL